MNEARNMKRRRVFFVAGMALFCAELLSFDDPQDQCEECRQLAARERETPVPQTVGSNSSLALVG